MKLDTRAWLRLVRATDMDKTDHPVDDVFSSHNKLLAENRALKKALRFEQQRYSEMNRFAMTYLRRANRVDGLLRRLLVAKVVIRCQIARGNVDSTARQITDLRTKKWMKK